jgi:hypothetical protein
VWLDFEARIPAPMPMGLLPIQQTTAALVPTTLPETPDLPETQDIRPDKST